MISGPTIPRTPDGVRGLIHRHLGVAEHGLALVVEDLELGEGCTVDALARDAAGAPMLVFGSIPAEARNLPARVLGAYTWFQSHGRFLVREYTKQGLDPQARVRLLVLGLDFLADTLRDLESLALAELQVHQFCSFSVGGELRVGATRLLGGEGRERGEADDPSTMFQVPSGVPPGPAADRCACFLDLVRRMDPRLTACGDRFSRQFHLGGRHLAELAVADGTPRVRLGDGEHALDTMEDCLTVVDRLVRQLLTAEVPPQKGPHPGPAGPVDRLQGLDEGRFSLEPIRQTVAAATISPDEYSALEDPEDVAGS